MSRLRGLFTGLPDVCGVPSALAKIEGRRNGEIFDLEVQDPESVFRQKLGQTTRQRMSPAFVAWAEFADADSLSFAIDLTVYAADCYGLNKAGLEHPQNLVDTRYRLEADSSVYPEIVALFSVEEATALAQWA